VGQSVYKVRHLLNRNSRAGSRKNIHAHYDIGNAFYQLWLDPSMTYSSALFSEGASLEAAQEAKYRRIADQLQLPPGARVLEIGCGWGGFAETAARSYGAHVTGLTLSTEQLAYARQRLQAAGLAARPTCSCAITATAPASTMPSPRSKCSRPWAKLLARLFRMRGAQPEAGRTCLHPDHRHRRRAVRALQQEHGFHSTVHLPGRHAAIAGRIRRAAEAQGLRVEDAFSFGLDYAETLRQWRASFLAQRAALEKQGFDGRFLLTWEFYLVLRGRLPGAQHGCDAIYPGQGLTMRRCLPPSCCR
jgi:cyclopropane-fatty-acyl-phospholipid synthase